MFELMAITKALSDETRIRLLAALEKGELCVCQLIELVALAPSTVSKHLSILRAARLIEARKQGRWMHYRLASAGAPPAVQQALDWLMTAVRTLPPIRQDRQRLAQIKETDPGVLCSQQTRQRQGGAVKEADAALSDNPNAVLR
jgi:ArsR family transcriptional regulator, arsenate/arsenite/antimonite-responsive transcriptional repressor